MGARRFGLAQFLHNFGEREPLGDFQTFGQTAAQFGARDVQDGDVVFVLDLVHRLVLRAFLDPDHVFEVDHFDADFFLVLAEQVLGVIRSVEVLTSRVLAGASVVAANDEVGAAVVLADQAVPDGFARARHAHGEVQERHGGGRLWVFVQNCFVAAHAGEVIDVARFGHADNRVDQQVGLRLFCGAEGQFLVRAVQRIAGLEGNNLAPAQFAEVGAQFVRGVAAGAEVVVNGLLDADNGAAEVDLAGVVVQVVDSGVGVVVCAKDLLGLFCLVRLPAVGDGHGGEDHAFLVAQCDVLAQFQRCCEVFADVQRDWHRPERAVCKAHVVDNAVIVFLGQEAFERVEAAVHQKLQVTDLARGQVVADQVRCFDFELLGALVRDIELGDGSKVVLHWMGPVFDGGKPAGCSGEFCVQRVVFGELAREELICEAGFFRGAACGQRVGKALAFVGAGALADRDQGCVRRGAQKRVQASERDPQGRGRGPLRRIRRRIKLAQEAKEQVFLLGVWFGQGVRHSEKTQSMFMREHIW